MVKEKIVEWFEERGIVINDDNINKSYLDEGYVDSFGFLELISFCEEEFNIAFDNADFENENIFTLEGIVGVIESKL